MPQYIPYHDRPPYYSNLPTPRYPRNPPTPRYASPDFYPISNNMSSESEAEYNDENYVASASSSSIRNNGGQGSYVPRQRDNGDDSGPSRKRPRNEEESEYNDYQDDHDYSQQHQHQHQQQDHGAYHNDQYNDSSSMRLTGSIFNISPRNPFTSVVGDFILANTAGLENVEIEIKLGILMSVSDPQGINPSRRIRLPTQSEMIVPPDYPLGPFHATMHPNQHKTLNNLLNQAAQSSVNLTSNQGKVHFSRSKLTDSFHGGGSGNRSGKVRVSRSRETGQIVEVVKKRRIADLNVYCPNAAFDWRISVNVEEPYDMPDTPPTMTRDKDRASYKHQVCQVDLTHVMSKHDNSQTKPVSSFELEIEILDVPTLLAEGQAGSDRFDEILQNVLDTARMLIKNCDPPPQ
ncbi:uncharacterized protein L201_002233 [Kwoniella dendrophila CBS 6074]|uniref:mRNA-capping enzyme subunit beta n=1 Tax=Kwoniella dendrophila CBS 6074 TaxID=1295534 RepID=A0AAX4JPQ4_9TREE